MSLAVQTDVPAKSRVVGNDHFCDTSVIQQKGLPKDQHPIKKGEIPLYHRSGNKPLDSTTLAKSESNLWVKSGNPWLSKLNFLVKVSRTCG